MIDVIFYKIVVLHALSISIAERHYIYYCVYIIFFSKKNSPKYCVTIDIDTFEVTEILYFLPITILEDFYSFQSCILFLTPHPSKKKMKKTKRLYSWSRYIIHDNRAREKGRGEGLEKSQSGLESIDHSMCFNNTSCKNYG